MVCTLSFGEISNIHDGLHIRLASALLSNFWSQYIYFYLSSFDWSYFYFYLSKKIEYLLHLCIHLTHSSTHSCAHGNAHALTYGNVTRTRNCTRTPARARTKRRWSEPFSYRHSQATPSFNCFFKAANAFFIACSDFRSSATSRQGA